MHITEVLDDIQTWDKQLGSIPYTDHQIVAVAEYFIRNLPRNHTVPGHVYLQILGEMDWHTQYGSLTHRQRRWLMHHLQQYRDQIQD